MCFFKKSDKCIVRFCGVSYSKQRKDTLWGALKGESMQIKFFTIGIHDEECYVDEMNLFLRSHKIITVQREFINNGSNSYWSLCAEYHGTAVPEQETGKKIIDYKEILDEKQFSVFAKIRELRKTIADSEGVPVYTIVTNAQLAHIVTNNISTKAGLASIPGFGDKKMEKYGHHILKLLQELQTESGDRNEVPA